MFLPDVNTNVPVYNRYQTGIDVQPLTMRIT